MGWVLVVVLAGAVGVSWVIFESRRPARIVQWQPPWPNESANLMPPKKQDDGPAPWDREHMETLHEAVNRLERKGYRAAFRPDSGGRLTLDGVTFHAPEELIVDEVARFEGESDPEDEAVLFALRSADGRVRGTFIATYGAQTGPENAAVIRRLHVVPGPPA